jgi:hypothetical protein
MRLAIIKGIPMGRKKMYVFLLIGLDMRRGRAYIFIGNPSRRLLYNRVEKSNDHLGV